MTARLAHTKWQSLDTLFNVGTLGSLSDLELMECFRFDHGTAGQEAFRILVERHGPMVLGLCRSLISDPHDAEDAFQAVFLVLVRKGHLIWIRDSVGPWLFGVASRLARRAQRQSIQRRRFQVPLRDDIAEVEASASAAQGLDTEQVVQEEIADLPASLRNPIVLCSVEGLTYEMAARQLGVTEPTLRGRLHRARRRLASRLRERGILSALPATPIEPLRLHLPVLPPGLVTSTVQHASWWSSVSRLVAAESAIPASVVALARGALRSMFLNKCMMLGIALFLAAGALGTVVSAQQRKPPTPAPPSRPIESPVALRQGEPALPVQPAELPGLQRVPSAFRALIVGHEVHQARIKTLKCIIDERVSIDDGQTWKDLATWTMWKSGERERVHSTTHLVLNPNRTFTIVTAPRGERDVLFGPDSIRSMDGYDPAHPPAEPVMMSHELTSGNRIGGLIKPPQPFTVGGYRTGLAPDYLLLTLVDVMYSVRDLCEAEVNAAAQPLKREDSQGRPLWDLQLKAPPGHPAWDVRHEMPEGKYYSYVVTLSPRHGYAIVETEKITRVERGTGQPVLEIRDRKQVLDFQEPVPGIFLPKRVQVSRTRSDAAEKPQYLGENVIHDVEANGPIPEKALAFRFPRGIGVGDVGKDVYYIWGDRAPAMTLTTDQYNAWREHEMRKARGEVTE
jgi:RNA polymerase sigma factor (sigma-70 family)